jgi:hypothetical protein
MSTPRIDNAYKYPRRDRPSMNATLDSVYLEGQKLERELAEMRDKLTKLEKERDGLRILAGELIAVIRVNVMRGSFTDVVTEDLDAFLAPFVERLGPNATMSTPRIDNAYKYPRRDRLTKLEQERDRLRLIARELLADLCIVIDVARQNLPRAHGTIEGIAARLEVKSAWLEDQ